MLWQLQLIWCVRLSIEFLTIYCGFNFFLTRYFFMWTGDSTRRLHFGRGQPSATSTQELKLPSVNDDGQLVALTTPYNTGLPLCQLLSIGMVFVLLFTCWITIVYLRIFICCCCYCCWVSLLLCCNIFGSYNNFYREWWWSWSRTSTEQLIV